jgi:hypothetical protein
MRKFVIYLLELADEEANKMHFYYKEINAQFKYINKK